eukprot:1567487-Pleurochrysis_carterae.AAC.1
MRSYGALLKCRATVAGAAYELKRSERSNLLGSRHRVHGLRRAATDRILNCADTSEITTEEKLEMHGRAISANAEGVLQQKVLDEGKVRAKELLGSSAIILHARAECKQAQREAGL